VNEDLVEWKSLVVALQQEGYPLRILSLSDWRREFSAVYGELPDGWMSWLTPIPATDAAVAGAPNPSQEDDQLFRSPRVSFDCSETRRRLADSSVRCPLANEHLIRTYLRGLIAQDLLQSPPSEPLS
jgi:hypothetical protein